MDAAEKLKQAITERSKAADKKIQGLKEGVKLYQENRRTQKEQQRRPY